MAAKPEAPPAAAAAPAAGAAAPAAHAPAAKGGIGAWIPVIAALVLAPVVTWATVEFVLVPRLQKKLVAAVPAEGGEAAHAEESAPAAGHGAKKEGGGHGGKESKSTGAPNYPFSNVVVNLAGTMGTRYLKVSFIVTGKDEGIKTAFEKDKDRYLDITINVLSALTLADLEEPGSKNVLREKLVTAYNQAFGKKIAEQVYFSDFVIQ